MRPRLDSPLLVAGVLLALLATVTHAGELAGVELPDAIRAGGRDFVLNGMGLREATFLKVDVYVAGLYVERRSSNPEAILDPGEAKRVVMRFVRHVPAAKLVAAWDEGFAKNAGAALDELRSSIDRLNGWMTDVRDGDTITLTWLPGSGTEIEVAGTVAGTIPGEEFARALFSIWLGESPPNSALKEGMLGRL